MICRYRSWETTNSTENFSSIFGRMMVTNNNEAGGQVGTIK